MLYTLVGVVVHSGHAGGGHYYSFARRRDEAGTLGAVNEWLKFDDQEVSPIDLDDAVMEREWFGGDFTDNVWDNTTKRYVSKASERWFALHQVLFVFYICLRCWRQVQRVHALLRAHTYRVASG